jgi:LPPG:FO 2-phospho-L-lactate transferase
MTDRPVPTRILVEGGEIPFQDYFVRRRCPPIRGLRFDSIERSAPAPGAIEQIRSADAVVVCPSNPLISIGPILAVPGMRAALQETQAPAIAISPLIAGAAVKGPTAAMMDELGFEPTACGVASLYRDFIDVFVIDSSDEQLAGRISSMGVTVRTAPTLMDSPEAKIRLARIVLETIG